MLHAGRTVPIVSMVPTVIGRYEVGGVGRGGEGWEERLTRC